MHRQHSPPPPRRAIALSPSSEGQTQPPRPACVTTERDRVCAPPPHVSVHVVQVLHADTSQCTDTVLYHKLATRPDQHAVPLRCTGVVTFRNRMRVPPPHVAPVRSSRSIPSSRNPPGKDCRCNCGSQKHVRKPRLRAVPPGHSARARRPPEPHVSEHAVQALMHFVQSTGHGESLHCHLLKEGQT